MALTDSIARTLGVDPAAEADLTARLAAAARDHDDRSHVQPVSSWKIPAGTIDLGTSRG